MPASDYNLDINSIVKAQLDAYDNYNDTPKYDENEQKRRNALYKNTDTLDKDNIYVESNGDALDRDVNQQKRANDYKNGKMGESLDDVKAPELGNIYQKPSYSAVDDKDNIMRNTVSMNAPMSLNEYSNKGVKCVDINLSPNISTLGVRNSYRGFEQIGADIAKNGAFGKTYTSSDFPSTDFDSKEQNTYIDTMDNLSSSIQHLNEYRWTNSRTEVLAGGKSNARINQNINVGVDKVRELYGEKLQGYIENLDPAALNDENKTKVQNMSMQLADTGKISDKALENISKTFPSAEFDSEKQNDYIETVDRFASINAALKKNPANSKNINYPEGMDRPKFDQIDKLYQNQLQTYIENIDPKTLSEENRSKLRNMRGIDLEKMSDKAIENMAMASVSSEKVEKIAAATIYAQSLTHDELIKGIEKRGSSPRKAMEEKLVSQMTSVNAPSADKELISGIKDRYPATVANYTDRIYENMAANIRASLDAKRDGKLSASNTQIFNEMTSPAQMAMFANSKYEKDIQSADKVVGVKKDTILKDKESFKPFEKREDKKSLADSFRGWAQGMKDAAKSFASRFDKSKQVNTPTATQIQNDTKGDFGDN